MSSVPETGSGGKGKLVVTAPSYGSVTPSNPKIQDGDEVISKPVKVVGDSVPSAVHAPINNQPYTLLVQIRNSRGILSRWCSASRVMAAIAGISLLFLLLVLVVFFLLPPGHTNSYLTTQTGVVSVAEKVDPFWISNVVASKTDRDLAQLNATLVNCSSLVPRYTSSNWSSSNLPPTATNSNRQLIKLVGYSYLVRGSSVTVKVNILSSGSPPTLYLLDNWADYNKYATSGIPSQFVAAYPISNTGNTTHNITIKNTGFYFFLIHFPSETHFWYQFWVGRLYYNADDYTFTCATTSSKQPCRFSLAPTSTIGTDMQCLLVLPIGMNDLELDSGSVSTHTVRRPINTLTLTLLIVVGLAFIVMVSALIYPLVQPRMGPWCSQECHCCSQGMYKPLS